MAALVWREDREAQETSRRRLLGEADRILDEVEELRLGDRRLVPPALAGAIEALQQRLGRRSTSPATLAGAHRLVLALEGRLMIRNPRVAATQTHDERPVGSPVVTVLQGGLRWKLLTLPAAPPGGPDADWLELVEATVERARDRWAFAQEQARRAARDRSRFAASFARAGLAWANYWELSEEAARLRERTSCRPTRP